MSEEHDAIHALIEHAARTAAEDVPAEVMARSRELLLDTIGCILSGGAEAGIQPLRDTLRFWGGNPISHIFGCHEKTSPPQAAFINAVMGHANDFDDTHDKAVNHGCVTLVPAMFAVSDSVAATANCAAVATGLALPKKPVSGLDFCAALAVGLDVSNRLGLAFVPYLHVGWLPTTLWGPFACAAACGRLLGLSIEEMRDAFGLAYAQIHGNRQALNDGALAKRMQPGFSASAGVQAAFHAKAGLTAGRGIVDGPFGIPALYTNGRIDRGPLADGIGERYETMEVSIKPYPSCRCTHAVIDAALALKAEHGIGSEDIAEARIFLPPPSMGQIGQPFRVRDNPVVDAQFSAQYTAALAFREGHPKLDHFRVDFVRGSVELAGLAGRFETIEFEPDVSSLVPVEMHLKLTDGRSVNTRVEQALGSPANPMSAKQLTAKFNDCLDNATRDYSEGGRRKIIERVDRLAELADVTELTQLL